MKPFQRYILAGLLVWIPLGITFLILKLIVDLMDQTLVLLPAAYRPEQLLGFRIPGLGILLTGVVVFVTGVFTANLVGRHLLRVWDGILNRIPLVRSIYGSAKHFTEILLGETNQSFKRVVLVEWPRQGIYAVAFITGNRFDEVAHRTGEDIVAVFVPTTPNPTSGFVVLMPRRDIIDLDMDVESAFKLIVSLGVVAPTWSPGGKGATLAPPRPRS
ncbi:MAG: DUF502 domain-containing protein [Gammaproteobacteria bacterium]|nr:DUF502 domain-containing protein [Gammaproteobacteria bacterium]